MLGGGIKGGQVHGAWPAGAADLIDGDLNGVNDYRLVLAELLEKRWKRRRCRASSRDRRHPLRHRHPRLSHYAAGTFFCGSMKGRAAVLPSRSPSSVSTSRLVPGAASPIGTQT